MKLYIETLFSPNTSYLGKPQQEIQDIIICEEGIIFHGTTDHKLVIHNQQSINNFTHIISNIKLIEDNTKTSLKPIYNIPLDHHIFTLKREIYSIKNIRFIIEYHNYKLYNLYFDKCNIANDRHLIENTLKLIQTKC